MNLKNDDDDELMSDPQAAALLGLTNPKTLAVWRSTKRYNIPYAKIGRAVRYRKSDLRAFIAARTINPHRF